MDRPRPTVIVSAAYGTLGDFNPMATIVRGLVDAGADVTFVIDAYFKDRCDGLVAAGVRLELLGSYAEYAAHINDVQARWNRPLDTVRLWLSRLPQHYATLERLAQEALARGETPTLVAHPLDLAVRILEERRHVRAMTVLCQPWMLRSKGQWPSQFEFMPLPRWYPKSWKAGVYKAQDLLVDAAFAPQVNAFRVQLGLKPPAARIFHRYFQCAGPLLGMWPAWLVDPLPQDWPQRLRMCGFACGASVATDSAPDAGPFRGMSEELGAFVRASKDGGAPLVLVTMGTSPPPYATRVFDATIAACARLGARTVLVCGVQALMPKTLPAHVHACSFTPFDALLPHCAAFIYNGGFGGFAQALRTGTPQIIIPGRFDQPHNAHVAHRMRVGVRVSPWRASPRRLTAALTRAWAPEVRSAVTKFRNLPFADGGATAAMHIVEFATRLNCGEE